IGSNLTAGDTELSLRTLPDYSIRLLGEPFRLAIRIGKLEHTDYLLNNSGLNSGLISGSFSVSGADDDSYTLYFQLNSNAMYAVSASDGMLTVTLRPLVAPETSKQTSDDNSDNPVIDVSAAEKAADGEAYYVVANAFDMYRSGILECGNDMTPTLSSDMETILLISAAQSSKDAAQRLMDKLLASDGAVSAQWSIVKLKYGELPAYESGMEYLAAYDIAPCRINGKQEQGSIIIPDGLALTVTPDKSACLYSKRIKEYSDGGETIEYEQLWLCGYSSGSRAFSKYQFEQIVSAAFSPDGRRLAVLEMAGESAHLYVFDVDSRDLITDLSAVGFGDTISAYCWDSMGGRLFSIGGSGEISVHQYDFNVPDEAKRHSDVDKKGCDEGMIGFADGEVYFVETTMENDGAIYSIKPEGGSRRVFISGDNFSFAYIDMQTGDVTEITRGFNVFNFMWSLDGKKIFYFENRLSGSSDDGEGEEQHTDEYPYTLWVYYTESGVNKAVADLMSTSIIPGRDTDTVYICYTDKETLGSVVHATYALNTAQ
ncbi:MAG: hypothetical protein KH409_09225, partial [Clostridium sp.]|nr:hypothetical protein [Clostridium sp.]